MNDKIKLYSSLLLAIIITGFVSYLLVVSVQREIIKAQDNIDRAIKEGCEKHSHSGNQWVYKCPDGLWLEREIAEGKRK